MLRTVAGRYRLLEHLGAGGMGSVWRADDLLLARQVAVKELTLPAHLDDAEREVLRARMRREARAAARLDHPSALTVFDVVEEDGRPWLVMELVEAGTLADDIRARGPLPPERTATVGLALLGALEAAHARGILHRDVKPSNVLVTSSDAVGPGRVVLTDFGIATTEGDPTVTATGELVGSPSFMAPERGRGEAPGPASDLWSLGATLYTAVEGVPPYAGPDALTTLLSAMHDQPRACERAGPLAPVLEGLLEKDPARRLDAAGARALLTAVAAGSVRAAGPPEVEQPPRDRPTDPPRLAGGRGRGRLLVALLAAAGLLAAVLTAVGLSGTRPAGRTTNGAATRPAPSSAATPAPTGAPSPAPASGQGTPDSGRATPASSTRYSDPAGWTLGFPDGWRAGATGTQHSWRDAATGRSALVDTEPLGGDVLAAVRDTARSFAGRHQGYRELRLVPVTWFGRPATDWELTYTDGGTRLHADIRNVVVRGRSYAVLFQTHDSDWEASAALRESVFSSFQPA